MKRRYPVKSVAILNSRNKGFIDNVKNPKSELRKENNINFMEMISSDKAIASLYVADMKECLNPTDDWNNDIIKLQMLFNSGYYNKEKLLREPLTNVFRLPIGEITELTPEYEAKMYHLYMLQLKNIPLYLQLLTSGDFDITLEDYQNLKIIANCYDIFKVNQDKAINYQVIKEDTFGDKILSLKK